jgi:hypothetical protein
MHFVDLEPKGNNKTIYNLHFICNTIITIEAPRKKNIIAQCNRFQNYGHTKTYCTRPFMCVKCGGEHNTTVCRKKPNTPAKCGHEEEHTQLTIKDVTYTQIYKNQTPKRTSTTSEHYPTKCRHQNDNNQFPQLKPQSTPDSDVPNSTNAILTISNTKSTAGKQ